MVSKKKKIMQGNHIRHVIIPPSIPDAYSTPQLKTISKQKHGASIMLNRPRGNTELQWPELVLVSVFSSFHWFTFFATIT